MPNIKIVRIYPPPHQKCVEIGVEFGKTPTGAVVGGATSSVIVLGSDLTQEYVVINADYRS
jgi:N-acetylglutamate synthase/N-acetylornithine aminotransferase